MSWTSSLIFAVQYAIWRLHQGSDHSASDIKICAVDTRDFPHGQFARDLCLLDAYHETAGDISDPKVLDFFDFREGYTQYYNGEYLSQGFLKHVGRSSITSLGELREAGLFELYPDFDNANGKTQWAKRVLELRNMWSSERTTTDCEIQLALQIEFKCFSRFEKCSIASMLLAFRNRVGELAGRSLIISSRPPLSLLRQQLTESHSPQRSQKTPRRRCRSGPRSLRMFAGIGRLALP